MTFYGLVILVVYLDSLATYVFCLFVWLVFFFFKGQFSKSEWTVDSLRTVPLRVTGMAAPEGSLPGTATQHICLLSGVDERSVVHTNSVGGRGKMKE